MGKSAEKKLKIITNFAALKGVRREDIDLEIMVCTGLKYDPVRLVKVFFKSLKYDYVLINCSAKEVLLFAFCFLIFPFSPCKLISLDAVLSVPESRKDRMVNLVKALLLKRVYRFIEYFKNTEGFQKYYRIPARKFAYIPFKINSYEMVLKTKTTDGGYVFVGGKSRRDFATLFEAGRGLDIPIKVVSPPEYELNIHGSILANQDIPANIEWVHDDGSSESFINFIANSRLVVLPLNKRRIAPSGISVYIVAMALQKCVIITSGPGVDDLLANDMAIILPPDDPAALRQAIVKAYNDIDYRNIISKKGHDYAMGLQGEQRLVKSVIDYVCDDFLALQKTK
jgi:glycosyltransferase involved in cell wall biosynthesis